MAIKTLVSENVVKIPSRYSNWIYFLVSHVSSILCNSLLIPRKSKTIFDYSFILLLFTSHLRFIILNFVKIYAKILAMFWMHQQGLDASTRISTSLMFCPNWWDERKFRHRWHEISTFDINRNKGVVKILFLSHGRDPASTWKRMDCMHWDKIDIQEDSTHDLFQGKSHL